MGKKISNKALASLLDNELFMQWILSPNEILDAYWMQEIEDNPEMKDNIDILKHIIKSIQIDEPILDQGDKKILWNKINNQIVNDNKSKTYRKIYLFVAAIASVVLLGIVGIYFYTNKNSINEIIRAIDYAEAFPYNEINLNGNTVTLVVEKGETIPVKENSTILEYDQDGSIIIDSRKIIAENKLNQLIVPYGKISYVKLSDGTEVHLNAGSRIIYPSVFGNGVREIYAEGEIFINVAATLDKQPFVVKTSQMNINVVGTSFNVSAYRDEDVQSIVLVTGKIRVEDKLSSNEYNMSPNQLFSCNKLSDDIILRSVDVNHIMAKFFLAI